MEGLYYSNQVFKKTSGGCNRLSGAFFNLGKSGRNI